MSNLRVANIILDQLGGNRFRTMTGAKDFVGSEKALSFSLPRTRDFVKNGINKVRVTLTPADDYTVEFFKIRGIESKTVNSVEGVYAENLQEVFTRYTGLATRLRA